MSARMNWVTPVAASHSRLRVSLSSIGRGLALASTIFSPQLHRRRPEARERASRDETSCEDVHRALGGSPVATRQEESNREGRDRRPTSGGEGGEGARREQHT